MSYIKSGLPYIVTKFVHPNDTTDAWNEFLYDKTENKFTNPGVVRVNESIRTYVWEIPNTNGNNWFWDGARFAKTICSKRGGCY